MPNNRDDIVSWSRSSITQSFREVLVRRFGAYDHEWKGATTLEELYRLRGKAEVLDFINTILTEPESYL